MRKTAFMVFVVLAVLAAAGCKHNATSPNDPLMFSNPPVNPPGPVKEIKDPVIGIKDLVGIWQATKAEGCCAEDPDMLRDLVAEGGTVTLVLEAIQAYSVTVTMPGETSSVDTGIWYYHEFWGSPQIDFYPSSIPDPEYGEIPSFYVSLSDNIMTLSSGGARLLPVDFGLYDPKGCYVMLHLVLTR